jgi:hypothetical protein
MTSGVDWDTGRYPEASPQPRTLIRPFAAPTARPCRSQERLQPVILHAVIPRKRESIFAFFQDQDGFPLSRE